MEETTVTMERMTEDGEKKSSVKAAEAYKRLSDYEDTGLLPDQITNLKEYADNLRMELTAPKTYVITKTPAEVRGECEN